MFAQLEDYTFNHFKNNGDTQIVYFKIIGIPDDLDEKTKVQETLVSDENINGCEFFDVENDDELKCRLEISNGISVNYVNQIILSTGYSIDLSGLRKKSDNETPEGIFFSPRYSFFDGFNGLEGYDREKSMEMSSEDYYQQQKETWVSNNPDKYKEIKESNDTLIIIKQKDMQVYTEEKRQYIISHPEKYLIEE
ncbi:MAG: hypothetical protein C0596_08690 [Marinilabiliales bacterium]|nr:MAG: hypothetical protein C0596_08690 [Marinilabiliales bacterium]